MPCPGEPGPSPGRPRASPARGHQAETWLPAQVQPSPAPGMRPRAGTESSRLGQGLDWALVPPTLPMGDSGVPRALGSWGGRVTAREGGLFPKPPPPPPTQHLPSPCTRWRPPVCECSRTSLPAEAGRALSAGWRGVHNLHPSRVGRAALGSPPYGSAHATLPWPARASQGSLSPQARWCWGQGSPVAVCDGWTPLAGLQGWLPLP